MLTEAGDDLGVVDRRAYGHLQLLPDVVQRTHVLERHVRHRREALSGIKKKGYSVEIVYFSALLLCDIFIISHYTKELGHLLEFRVWILIKI